MGLENVWHCFSWICAFCFSPLFISGILSMNPFWKKAPHKGFYVSFSEDLNQKGNPRRYPFKVPLWAMALMYVIATAMFVVPTYLTHHNSGTNDGWNVDPVPLLFAVASILFTNLWQLQYISTPATQCTNIGHLQVVTIFSTFMAFFFMLPRHSAWWSMGLIGYNIFWAIKVYLEDLKRCPIESGVACRDTND